MKKLLISLSVLVVLIGSGLVVYQSLPKGEESTFGLAYFRSEQSIVPFQDSKYYLGTTTPSTKAWASVFTDEICLTGDTCETAWPTGGGGGGGGGWDFGAGYITNSTS